MRLRVPDFPVPDLTSFLRDLFAELDERYEEKLNSQATNEAVYLSSPDGSVFQVAVADDGTLSATKVAG